ncbi:hypothetical protein GTG28_01705 [Vibrio sp. OCN044]|uniref:Lipoprotein n=1 Tax=Vibrio tetraodonis subsp. pristinus TaxID=2695891 RepID=A0A6L8LPI0_9VIBR|nr:hypothetical protein [Vibrio tetraodonis]MYM57927.1 hypothetical protein [Vibrio tetraodonis subsp. pristinus]
MLTRFVTLLLLLSTSGCTLLTPPVYPTPPENSKIGLLFLVEKKPRHINAYTPVFLGTSFSKPAATNKDYEKAIKSAVTSEISGRYQISDLEPSQQLLSVINKPKRLLDFSEDAFMPEIQNLANQHNLNYVLIIDNFDVEYFGYNNDQKVQGFGLATQCTAVNCSAYALNRVRLRMYSVKDGEYIGNYHRYKHRLPIKIWPDQELHGEIEDVTPEMINTSADLVMEEIQTLSEEFLTRISFIENKDI